MEFCEVWQVVEYVECDLVGGMDLCGKFGKGCGGEFGKVVEYQVLIDFYRDFQMLGWEEERVI